MTDPITAHDLAEALREGVKDLVHYCGECPECDGVGLTWVDGQEFRCSQCKGSGVRGYLAPSWQALLDRYDAQQRDYLELFVRYLERQCDLWMEEARMRKQAG